jgi:hypothetical protein
MFVAAGKAFFDVELDISYSHELAEKGLYGLTGEFAGDC